MILLLVHFKKIPLFSKDLTTVILSFISLFVSISLEPLNNGEGFVLILVLYPASKEFLEHFHLC